MSDHGPTLGELLRGLRTRNHWTLQEMSDKTGIPRSTLAKVEHDRLTLGYDKLQQISQRLKMRMSELFAAPGDESETRALTRRSVGTLQSAVHVDSPNYEHFFLCPDLRKKRMIPMLSRVRARTLAEFGELVRHSGEEFFYVLEGRIEVHTEFYEPIIVEKGQCIYLDSTMGHAYLAGPGCEEAVAVGGCASADETLLDSFVKPGFHEGREAANKAPVIRVAEVAAVRQTRKAAPRAKARRR
ncbi:MAG: XRE family transcriptional regulator [Gammaproteobacteria bacterium]